MSLKIVMMINDVETEHHFIQDQVRVGRHPENDLVISDNRISGYHGQLISYDKSYVFIDLDSRNGSMINRKETSIALPPNTPVELEEGDCILLGDRQNPISLNLVSIRHKSTQPAQNVEETILARVAIEMPQTLESTLAHLIYELSAQEDEYILLNRSLQTCLNHFKQVSGIGYYEVEDPKNYTVKSTPLVWLSALHTPPALPSSTLTLGALKSKEVVTYLPMMHEHEESESILGLEGALVAPLCSSKDEQSERFGVIYMQSRHAPFSEEESIWMGALSAYLGARLQSAYRFNSLRKSTQDLKQSKDLLQKQLSFSRSMIGESELFKQSMIMLNKVAPTEASVLILGETGTGKELAARYVHEQSKRSQGPFHAINCGALSESLLQSELFGHVSGAFTGASKNQKGAFAYAEGGTLFLDEIGEISSSVQVALLRVLQEKEYTPVGSQKAIATNVRIIMATHKDLIQEVKEGRFREDLYYRISVFPLTLPPLRQRLDDLPLLVDLFIDLGCARHNVWTGGISKEALHDLTQAPWPGNIRQLQHELERAVILADGHPMILPEHLNVQRQSSSFSSADLPSALNPTSFPKQALLYDLMNSATLPLKGVMSQLEEYVIQTRLEHHGQNRTRCAESLEISRQALQAKLSKWRDAD